MVVHAGGGDGGYEGGKCGGERNGDGIALGVVAVNRVNTVV